MKIDYFIKEYGIFIYMALILVISCFAVNNISYTKGQLDMCESNGMFFTSNKTCITCEESGRISLNNKCVIPKTTAEVYDIGSILQS